jgi:hypothetical protein
MISVNVSNRESIVCWATQLDTAKMSARSKHPAICVGHLEIGQSSDENADSALPGGHRIASGLCWCADRFARTKVWAVDVGMSRYYGGEVQVLEVIDDEILQIVEF